MKNSIIITLVAMFAVNPSWGLPEDLVCHQAAPGAGKMAGRPAPISAPEQSPEKIAQKQIEILALLVQDPMDDPLLKDLIIDYSNGDMPEIVIPGSDGFREDDMLYSAFHFASESQKAFNNKYAGHKNAAKAGSVLDDSAEYQEVYKKYYALAQEVLERTEDAKPNSDDPDDCSWALRQECLKFDQLFRESPVRGDSSEN